MACTWNADAMRGFSSTFNFTTFKRPLVSAAS